MGRVAELGAKVYCLVYVFETALHSDALGFLGRDVGRVDFEAAGDRTGTAEVVVGGIRLQGNAYIADRPATVARLAVEDFPVALEYEVGGEVCLVRPVFLRVVPDDGKDSNLVFHLTDSRLESLLELLEAVYLMGLQFLLVIFKH